MTSVTIYNDPVNDPQFLIIEKLSADGDGTPQGNQQLHGARYRLNFYHSDNATGTPYRSWVFETQPIGNRAWFDMNDASHMVSGSALFRDTDGNVIWPLGSISIQEIQAPQGFLLDPTRFTARIIVDNSNPYGARFDWILDPGLIMERRPDGSLGHRDLTYRGTAQIRKNDAQLGTQAHMKPLTNESPLSRQASKVKYNKNDGRY